MSGFSEEVTSKSLDFAKKIAESIFAIIKSLIRSLSVDYAKKLQKLNWEKAKCAHELDEALKEIGAREGVEGFIDARKLEASGLPLKETAITGPFAKVNEKDLYEACKRLGIVVAIKKNKSGKYIDGELSTLYVMCKLEHTEKLYEALSVMQDKQRMRDLILKKEEYELKGFEEFMKGKKAEYGSEDWGSVVEKYKEEFLNNDMGLKNLSDEERVEYFAINAEISALERGARYERNDEHIKSIIAGITTCDVEAESSFSAALSRDTSKVVGKGSFIVADAVNPERHIICNYNKATFRGEDYTKTTFDVYDGGQKVFSTHDGRFKGRAPDITDEKANIVGGYWHDTKMEIKEKGQFSDTVLKFRTKEDYQDFLSAYETRKTACMTTDELKSQNSSYKEKYEYLNKKLSENGYAAARKNGEPVMVNTLNEKVVELKYENALSREGKEQLTNFVIAKQAVNYKTLSDAQTNLRIAQYELEALEPGSDAYNDAAARIKEHGEAYREAKLVETKLLEERSSLNSAVIEFDKRPYFEHKDKDMCDFARKEPLTVDYTIKTGLVSELDPAFLDNVNTLGVNLATAKPTDRYAILYANDKPAFVSSYSPDDKLIKSFENKTASLVSISAANQARLDLQNDLQKNWLSKKPDLTEFYKDHVEKCLQKGDRIPDVVREGLGLDYIRDDVKQARVNYALNSDLDTDARHGRSFDLSGPISKDAVDMGFDEI